MVGVGGHKDKPRIQAKDYDCITWKCKRQVLIVVGLFLFLEDDEWSKVSAGGVGGSGRHGVGLPCPALGAG